jgi:hypothetical protein
MRTDFAYVAMKLTDDDSRVFHMCFYESKPSQEDLQGLLDELTTDPEFKMTNLTPGIDYDMYFFEGEQCKLFKESMGIPNEVEDNTSGELGN